MTSITFDTLTYAKRLEEAGCEKHLAEAHAIAQAELLANLIENKVATKDDLKAASLATKEDLRVMREETQNDLRIMREETHNGLRAMREETQKDLRVMREETQKDLRVMKDEMKQIEVRLEKKIDHLEYSLMFKLGGFMLVLISVATTFLGFLMKD